MDHYWGIDLGGTKIEGVIIEAKSKKELIRHRIPTEKEGGYRHIVKRIKLLTEELTQQTKLKPEAIGIGTPGAIDPPTGLLKNSNTTVLNGQPFNKDLEEALQIPVRMSNDANCFAMAETHMGIVAQKLPKAQTVFGVIMGTGVGAGIVINGKILNGAHGIAGEWGHSFLDHSSGYCYCDQNGCVENIISGPALERYYFSITGQKVRLPQILANYHANNDRAATATIDRLLHFFGRGLANIVNILDPDAIVLGGGLGNIDLLYSLGREKIAEFVFNPRLDTPILKPALGDSAGVLGAALLLEN